MTTDQLTEAFAAGRSILVCCGDAAPPALLPPTTTLANKFGREVLVIAIDLEQCYLRLLAAIQKHQRLAAASN